MVKSSCSNGFNNMNNELTTIKKRIEEIKTILDSLNHKLVQDTVITNIVEFGELENLILELQSQIGIMKSRLSCLVNNVQVENENPFSQKEFSLFSSKIKIGQMAQAVFPFIFSHQLITDEILMFLCSQESVKYFKTERSECTLLRLYTGDDRELYDSKGRKRYYSNIHLHYLDQTFVLTTELWSRGLENLTKFFYKLGLNIEGILAICSGNEQLALKQIQTNNHSIDIISKLKSNEKISHRQDSDRNTISLDITHFPYKVGSLAKILFPILCERKMLSKDDVEYLQSVKARQRMKTRGNTILKPVNVPEEELWSSGHKRYYSDIKLTINNSSFYLTSQFYPNSTQPLLEYILGLGMTFEEIMQLCKSNNAKLIQQTSKTIGFIQKTTSNDLQNEPCDAESEHDTITISFKKKMHTTHLKGKH